MKIRTDFVTNSSSSSFCISLGIKTKDTSDWNYFDIGPDVCVETKCSPKQLAGCDTIRDMFQKFHDESSVDGYTIEEMYDWRYDYFEEQKYKMFVEEVSTWGNFFKFYDDEKVEGFLDEHGEKRVSEYITDIGIFCHEEPIYYNGTYQDTEYTYNLETGEYIGKISGNVDIICDERFSDGIVVPDEEEVTVYSTEFIEDEEQVSDGIVVPDKEKVTADFTEYVDITKFLGEEELLAVPHGSLEDDFDDSSVMF